MLDIPKCKLLGQSFYLQKPAKKPATCYLQDKPTTNNYFQCSSRQQYRLDSLQFVIFQSSVLHILNFQDNESGDITDFEIHTVQTTHQRVHYVGHSFILQG